MKVILLKDKETKEFQGYDLVAETNEDNLALGTIRNAIFFGIDENEIKYAGMEAVEGQNIVKNLSWRKEKFIK